MKIALAGNPNSGKTTIYNALTGKLEKVGNWAGVTVERKEAKLKSSFGKNDVDIIDLPGAYSMSPYTSEESITRDFVMLDRPDVIINIVDSSNLSRSLFFTSQLMELGIPMVIALNKSDVAKRKKNIIDIEGLSKELNCPIVETTAVSEVGLADAVNAAYELGKSGAIQMPLSIEGIENSEKREDIRNNDKKRFDFINGITTRHLTLGQLSYEETTSDKFDKVIAHRVLGIPIFIAVLWIVFSISQTYVGPIFADWLVALLESFAGWVETSLVNANVNEFLTALILNGIIGGISAVIGFLPLIMVLFFLLSLLEDFGYMARVAVILDPYFKKIGLSGKSVVPMFVGSGCAIPGIMATRTIKGKKERNMTAILTPFIPCGAKLPIIALFTAAYFGGSGWVGPLMYFIAIIVIILAGLFIKAITGASIENNFIIELPEYKLPSIKRAFLSMFDRAKGFIIKAGTIILLCNAVVWLMSSYSWSLQPVEGDGSILASIANPLAVLFIPLGFGVWQFTSAAITGFIAKENVVGALAVVFSLSEAIDTEALEMVAGNETVISTTFGLTTVAAVAFMVFNLFTPPCFAAMGAMNSEIQGKKWFWYGILFQTIVGYLAALITYQVGTLIFYGTFGNGFAVSVVIVLVAIACGYMLIQKQKKLN